MKLTAKIVPFSSVVGYSVALHDDADAVAAIVMVSVPRPSLDYKAVAAPIIEKIAKAFSDPAPTQEEAPSMPARAFSGDSLIVWCSDFPVSAAMEIERLRPSDPSPVAVGDLPDAVRIPLHELQADVDYLLGRVAVDGSCMPMISASIKAKLAAIETALSAAPKAPGIGEAVAWRPEVVAFANLMESVLRDNDDKDGWKDCGPRWLFERLKEEVAELDDAGTWKPDNGPMEGAHGRRLARECADVANFAMMIADVSGGLPLHASPPPSRAEVAIPALAILAIRDALVNGDQQEAFHQLRMVVDADCSIALANAGNHWAEVEKRALAQPDRGGEGDLSSSGTRHFGSQLVTPSSAPMAGPAPPTIEARHDRAP